MSAESADAEIYELSFELRLEISRALSAYLAHADGARERLHKATQRVCTEAHALRLSSDEIVAVLKRLFERTPLTGNGDPDLRRAAWEEFTHSCISAYYNAGEA
ncbi:MAG: hypothetical protein JWN79_2012 [Gemmatimonadetes bacterium]|jgi:hypothetical protein|nr:hypothetical protein [Gemmatimonadota bacterium]